MNPSKRILEGCKDCVYTDEVLFLTDPMIHAERQCSICHRCKRFPGDVRKDLFKNREEYRKEKDKAFMEAFRTRLRRI